MIFFIFVVLFVLDSLYTSVVTVLSLCSVP